MATGILQIELPEFDPKNLPEWADEFSHFLLLTGKMRMSGLSAQLSESRGKRNLFRGK